VRVFAVAVVTLAGVLVSQVYPAAYAVAVGVCLVAFGVLLRQTLRHPTIASLRHAAIGAGACALIALIVGLLLVFATDLPLEVRVQLRVIILAAATAPALYWLLLVVTDGFEGSP
jgi:hypothetical protein